MRTAAAVLLALALASPAAAQTPVSSSDLQIEFAQAPRLAQALPVTIRTTGPASYRATAEIRVAGKAVGEATARGRSRTRGTLIPLRVPLTTRARAARQARLTGRAPVAVVTVAATLEGRPGVATASIRSALRRQPFYDGPLRAPDAPREATRRFAISWDLPFEFTQVYGAIDGTPSRGTFRKVVAARPGGRACTLLLAGSATTARAPGHLTRGISERGSRGPWRFQRGPHDVVASRRAPAGLPGARSWLVARFHIEHTGEGCPGEETRTIEATLRRVIRSVTIRFAALQLGPGYHYA